MYTKNESNRVKKSDVSSSKKVVLLRKKLNSLEKEFLKVKSQLTELDKESDESLLPISIFDKNELGTLECVVKYLHENRGLSFKHISSVLNRDNKVLWTVYKKASEKKKALISDKSSKFFIPVDVLSDDNLGILESLVYYLRNEFNLKYAEIARYVNRNQRTIWTTYKRAERKLRHIKHGR